MVTANGLLRVFWPSDVPRGGEQGTIIGWRNSPLDFFVVLVLRGVEAKKAEIALHTGTLYRDAPHPTKQLFNLCGHSWMGVLGPVNPMDPSSVFDPNHLQAYTQSSTLFPKIFCPLGNNVTVQVVVFQRPAPHQMQYMSLTPIPLVLGDKPLSVHLRTSPSVITELNDEAERAQKARLLEKLKLHTVIRHPPSRKEVLLPIILTQINCCTELSNLVNKNLHLIKGRQRRSPSVSKQVVEQATNFWVYLFLVAWKTFLVRVYPFIAKGFYIALIAHRIFFLIILLVLFCRQGV